MSKRAQLKRELVTLTDLKNIFSAMKNLSLIETGKLSRFFEIDLRRLKSLEDAIADFHGSYGTAPSPELSSSGPGLFLLLGSERGFCGGFNDRVLEEFERISRTESPIGKPTAIVIGSRLCSKMEKDPRVKYTVAGPGGVDEIPRSLSDLSDRLAEERASLSLHRLRVIYNQEIESRIEITVFSPFESFLQIESRDYPSRVRLNLPPPQILSRLLDYYLLVVLQHVSYASLMAEHRERLRLMEGAVHQLEKERDRTMLRMNTLRQEEITEEIEIILLNAGELT